jgi:cytochrome bd-type quinol oxidase subunit 2
VLEFSSDLDCFSRYPLGSTGFERVLLYATIGIGLAFLPLVLMAGLVIFTRQKSEVRTFITSSLLILTMSATALYSLYPKLLPSSKQPSNSLTIYTSATNEYGLQVGLIWFSVGFLLMLAYVIFMYHSF